MKIYQNDSLSEENHIPNSRKTDNPCVGDQRKLLKRVLETPVNPSDRMPLFVVWVTEMLLHIAKHKFQEMLGVWNAFCLIRLALSSLAKKTSK